MEMAVMTIEDVLEEIETVEDAFTTSFLGIDGFVLIMEELGMGGQTRLGDTLIDVVSALKSRVWTETTAAIAELKERLANREVGQELGKVLQRKAELQQQERDGAPI